MGVNTVPESYSTSTRNINEDETIKEQHMAMKQRARSMKVDLLKKYFSFDYRNRREGYYPPFIMFYGGKMTLDLAAPTIRISESYFD